jgi:hypothetical protein
MAKKTKTTKTDVPDGDYIRMYYEHQYDRVGKLESMRLSITNVVITLSVASFTFVFSNDQPLNILSGVVLPVILIVSNIFAVVYIFMSLKVIRSHVNRARIVLSEFASPLIKINDQERPPKWTDKFNIAVNQIFFHILLIVLSSVPIWLYYSP